MGYIAFAVVAALILCGVMGLLEHIGFGRFKEERKLLKITAPENVDYGTAFGDILMKYTAFHSLIRMKTTELGSLYQLSYEVTVKKNMSEKEFIDELRCRNGNLNISLGTIMTGTEGYF